MSNKMLLNSPDHILNPSSYDFDPNLLTLWGKKKTYTDTNYWLPVMTHLIDTQNIIKYLYTHKFPDHSVLNVPLDVVGAMGFLHDFGKITPAFQEKRLDSPKPSAMIDFPRLPRMDKSPHNLAGQALLSDVLSPSLCAVIGAHHGIPTSTRDVKLQKYAYKQNLGTSQIWQNMRQNALEYIKTQTPNFDQMQSLKLNQLQISLLTGLVIAADWLASNDHYFPLISETQTFEDIDHAKRFEQGITLWEKEDQWKPQKYTKDYFNMRFGFEKRQLQEQMLNALTQVEQPGLAIIEAPMGSGKTETALALAEDYAAKTHKSGIYFALPTQATATGLYPRIANWLNTQKGIHGLKLMHSKAAFYQKITLPHVISNSYYKRKLTPLESFGVGTIDQLLSMSLKARHVFLKHLGFSNKVVIIDEIHAYDAYTFAYLKRTLEYLGKYHVPVIALSATLSSHKREELINAYTEAVHELTQTGYPLITYTDNQNVKQDSAFTVNSNKEITLKMLNEDISMFINTHHDFGTLGVIVNSVDRAQAIAQNINKPCIVLHSRFLPKDRASIEKEIMRLVGKNGERPNDFVIIGTQVLEQSLDIDFDTLITDLAPIDLLLQRMGRLQRFNIKHKVKPVVFVSLGNNKVNTYLYDESILNKTLEVLNDKTTITLPRDISPFVETVYSNPDSAYIEKLTKQEIKAKTFMLNTPNENNNLNNFLTHRLLDGDKSAIAEMQVRDIKPQITAIVNDPNLSSFDLLQNTITLPRKLTPNIEQSLKHMKNADWQNDELLKDQPMINLPCEMNGYTVRYNSTLGLIATKIWSK